MTDHDIALHYAPTIFFDRLETIPLRAVGYTIARQTMPSASFPKRSLTVRENASFVIEYAYYWNYDIQHGYDLEHIWVTVGKDGRVMNAEGSFHGAYLNLFAPDLTCARPPIGDSVEAFCQPGKHAFLPNGQLFRLIPGWFESCNAHCGGAILIGNPFSAQYSPTRKICASPTQEENQQCERYIKEHLAFEPSMEFTMTMPETVEYMPWPELYAKIPEWIRDECARVKKIYEGVSRS